MAVLAPMPMARVAMAMTVKRGFRRSLRMTWAISRMKPVIVFSVRWVLGRWQGRDSAGPGLGGAERTPIRSSVRTRFGEVGFRLPSVGGLAGQLTGMVEPVAARLVLLRSTVSRVD